MISPSSVFILVMDWLYSYLLRSECIPQKQVAFGSFDTDKCAPARMFWGKIFAGNESGPFAGRSASGHLRCECQKEFIQALLSEKVSHQLRATFDKYHITWVNLVDRFQDIPRS